MIRANYTVWCDGVNGETCVDWIATAESLTAAKAEAIAAGWLVRPRRQLCPRCAKKLGKQST